MENNKINFRLIASFGIISLISIMSYNLILISNTDTTVVFCDVGQGDGAYIRVKNKTDVLIDAGPDKKILRCLGKYMPFYDHKIEIALMSHPQKDHVFGYIPILDRYKIDLFIMSPLKNQSKTFSALLDKIIRNKIHIYFAKASDRIALDGTSIYFYWPTDDFFNANLVYNQNDKEFGYSRLDDNYFSYIFRFQTANSAILFTGDIPGKILNSLPEQPNLKTTILKVPHHGSKNGLTQQFLGLANPRTAVISVGKNNPYGHPSISLLEMLKASNTIIRRTDKEGDIVFKFK